jgi:hypothetical protein
MPGAGRGIRQTRAGTRLNSTCPGRVGPSRRKSDAGGKGTALRHRQGDFSGCHPAIPLTVAYSAIFVTTGQEQFGNRMKTLMANDAK